MTEYVVTVAAVELNSPTISLRVNAANAVEALHQAALRVGRHKFELWEPAHPWMGHGFTDGTTG